MDDKIDSQSAEEQQDKGSKLQEAEIGALKRQIEMLLSRVTDLESKMAKEQTTEQIMGPWDRFRSNPTLNGKFSRIEPTSATLDNVVVSQPAIPGILCDVRWVTSTIQDVGNPRKSEGMPPFEISGQLDLSSKSVAPLTVDTCYNKDGNRDKATITIESEGLRDLIKNSLNPLISHEGGALWKQKTVSVLTRNVVVIHCFDKLKEVAEAKGTCQDTKESQKYRDELKTFLYIIGKFEDETISGRLDVRKTGEISWANLWTLFTPGTEVIARPFLGMPQIFVVHRHGPGEDAFVVKCWAYDWNGSQLTRKLFDLEIRKFSQTKLVVELECYPLQYYEDLATGTDLVQFRKELIARGKKFRDLCIRPNQEGRLYQCDEYTPVVYARGENDRMHSILLNTVGGTSALRQEDSSLGIKSKVMIDASLYARYGLATSCFGRISSCGNRVCFCSLCTLSGVRKRWEDAFKNDQPAASDFGTEQELERYEQCFSLLPPRVLGYVVDRKRWAQIPVESINPINYDDHLDPWNKLTLDEVHKNNLSSMLRSHYDRLQNAKSKAKVIRDPIAGKGEGLVVLLHGIPGVGKTMTAEAIASHLQRPLLRIHASDFDYDKTDQVSSTLERYFHLAHSWGAILLLDESDVFLQARSRAEMTQNALVAVLLQHLEYFQGVLIMTTNRILTIDIAVQSRIHYAIRFGRMDQEQCKQVFHTFFEQMDGTNSYESEKKNIKKWLEQNMKEHVESGMNGRDFRNMFTNAQLLAYARDDRIALVDFQTIAKFTLDFRRDMQRNREIVEGQTAAGLSLTRY